MIEHPNSSTAPYMSGVRSGTGNTKNLDRFPIWSVRAMSLVEATISKTRYVGNVCGEWSSYYGPGYLLTRSLIWSSQQTIPGPGKSSGTLGLYLHDLYLVGRIPIQAMLIIRASCWLHSVVAVSFVVAHIVRQPHVHMHVVMINSKVTPAAEAD